MLRLHRPEAKNPLVVTSVLRLHRPEAKNPLVVTSLASGGSEPVPNRTICLGSINNRGHMV